MKRIITEFTEAWIGPPTDAMLRARARRPGLHPRTWRPARGRGRAVTPPLHIHGAGMVTAVGLDAPSTCAALRARLDGFRETRFVGPSGDWLIGAAVPLPRNWIGVKRMAHLAAGAIVEVLRQAFRAPRPRPR
jgi:hypothetical protein